MKSLLPSPLPLADWPKRDQRAWQAASDADPLGPTGGGGAAAWRPSTRHRNLLLYGAWLAWLASRGELVDVEDPGQRATRERVRAYLDAMEAVGLADHTRAGRLQSLSDMLRVMDPTAERGFIGRAAGRISRDATRARDLQSRLRPPLEVLRFGLEMMREADAAPLSAESAYAFRDGLLISLWVYRPLRISNLASLELGRSLLEAGDGYRIDFEAHEMKGHRRFSCASPATLAEDLRRYLEVFRPFLLARGETPTERELWVSQYGRKMKANSVGQIIRLRTAQRFGEALNPHLMRYLTATFLAEHEPEHLADVAAILGHRSLETSEKHYILANSMRAIAKFQDAVLSASRERRQR